MGRRELIRRLIKVLAALTLALGMVAAFVGLVGGLAMGGAVIQGDLRGDTLTVAFLALPILAASLFAFGSICERTRPKVATTIYSGVIMLVVAQLLLPAIP